MVKKANSVEKEPENLKPFMTDHRGSFRQSQLFEQIATSTDQSDYLWYRTSLEHKGERSYTLYVNTTGHEIYAFVNGKLVGQNHSSNGAFVFQLQSPVKLHPGKNYVSLLSGTVGLKNYGPLFELVPAGIAGGPVKLVGANGTAIDLTNSSWSYKSGLAGEHRQIHLDKAGHKWRSHNGSIPVNRPFTWYKSTFAAPVGEEAVVVDLLGLNKGAAWVNGNSLGRYWPSYTAAEMAGCHVCDYRGKFKAEGDGLRCLTGCGELSQRFYHVPRSFLRAGEPNTLVLFEEAGGDPTRAAFHTVVVGPCAWRPPSSWTTSRCRAAATGASSPASTWPASASPGAAAAPTRAAASPGPRSGRSRTRSRTQGVVHGQVHGRVCRRRMPVRRAHRAGHLLTRQIRARRFILDRSGGCIIMIR